MFTEGTAAGRSKCNNAVVELQSVVKLTDFEYAPSPQIIAR